MRKTIFRSYRKLFNRPTEYPNTITMPLDTKRLPVPDSSENPRCYAVGSEVEVPLVTTDGKRKDKRIADQVRPIFVKCSVISQARGSAYIELNNTKVICAVYGPREVTRREDFSMKGQLMCEFKFATFSCEKRRGHQQDTQEKDLSLLIQEALEPAVRMEKFPKARMDVFVTVLEDDGSCLGAAITCSSMALADAGIEMYDLVVGSSLRQHGDILLLDPTREEEYSPNTVHGKSENTGCLTIGFMPSLYQVSALYQQGILTVGSVNKSMKVCIDTCQRIYPVLQQSLAKSLQSKAADR